MLKFIIFVNLFLLMNPLKFNDLQPKYDLIFGNDYSKALQFLENNQQRIKAICCEYNYDSEVFVPIIFPELIRYSMVKDFFETTALELVYVSYGNDYADFSIGQFQMKPSFIEKLEHYILWDYKLNKVFTPVFRYKSNIDDEIRTERLKRLKSLDWQLKYLIAFCKVMENKHLNIKWNSVIEKINIFATAYNSDFEYNLQVLESKSKLKIFPYGINSDKTQYCYSDVSIYFYKNHYFEIFKK